MSVKTKRQAQNPLLLRSHRLMEAFAKSDDERDFYLDREEGFIVYVDLDKNDDELTSLEKELASHAERYCQIPKLTFYETKKIMEGFVNEKVYDIDTKEKLIDIIQSKEAREHFLEFLYDHHSELEKWQQYYQERWRIRIIEWLRKNDFQFVFEEDLDLSKKLIEKMKECLFNPKVGKDIVAARKLLASKAKTYYSNEALNPRPKRGRPPKQTAKLEVEPQVTMDIYTAVPSTVRAFLFTPDITNASAVTFSSKFETQEEFMAGRRSGLNAENTLVSLNQKLASLRTISQNWMATDERKVAVPNGQPINFDSDDDEDDDDEVEVKAKVKAPVKKPPKAAAIVPKVNSKPAAAASKTTVVREKVGRQPMRPAKRIQPKKTKVAAKPKTIKMSMKVAPKKKLARISPNKK